MRDPLDFDPTPGVIETVAPGVRRILAPNPSAMTFRGTNTYVVGQGTVAVIDPGPEDDTHLAAITAGLQGETVSHILVTHAHLDHAPLARRLAEQTGAPVLAFGDAVAGRSASMAALAAQGQTGGGEGVDTAFSPDMTLADGDVIIGAGWRLKALHTPGHMANHMCFALHDAVFSGDHVMGWSTSLISPPDGDMGAFMASCHRLLADPAQVFLPGHGAPVTDTAARLTSLIAHRKAREAQILQALSSTPTTIPDITSQVYTGLAAHLVTAAQRNVFAHLIDLASQNHINVHPHIAWNAHFARTQVL